MRRSCLSGVARRGVLALVMARGALGVAGAMPAAKDATYTAVAGAGFAEALVAAGTPHAGR